MKHMKFWTLIKVLGLTTMIHCSSASSEEMTSPDTGKFITGGIGLDEREEMYANRNQYNLRLSFAKATGAYISSVDLSIEPVSGNGAAMQFHDAGPLLFVRLIPGKYRVSATFEDKRQVLTVSLGSTGLERVLYWP
jgi:hypothetical protein